MESELLELQKSLVNEVSKGLEQVKQLKVSSSNNEQEGVLERMLSSYEEALLILTGRAPQEQCQSVITSTSDPPASSTSSICKVTESKGAGRGFYERKTRTDVVRYKIKASGGSSEVAPDDGYSWRKYGQKEILGSKFPRSYYRCAHRHFSPGGCRAKKQVHRSDDDPTMFDVTYRGVHTCQAETKIEGEAREMP